MLVVAGASILFAALLSKGFPDTSWFLLALPTQLLYAAILHHTFSSGRLYLIECFFALPVSFLLL
jgi:hypothetical protein